MVFGGIANFFLIGENLKKNMREKINFACELGRTFDRSRFGGTPKYQFKNLNFIIFIDSHALVTCPAH